MPTRLTAHFTVEELTFSETAARQGIDNSPGPAALANLYRLAELLERIRERVGGPLHISSGYRSEPLNALVGGSSGSAHMEGRAADFTAAEFGSPLAVARAVAAAGLPFDQLIHEYGRWVHIAIAAPGETPRRQLLTIDRAGTRSGLE